MNADQVLNIDITELADRVSEAPFTYHATADELSALAWIGDRYTVSTVLRDAVDDDTNTINIDPWDVSEALTADDIDRVPCLSEDTALARIIWAIGPQQ